MREKNGPKEIFALLSAGYFGDEGQIIVRVQGTGATLSVYASDEDLNHRISQIVARSCRRSWNACGLFYPPIGSTALRP